MLQKYRSYLDASRAFNELYVRYESCWHKIQTEITILQGISVHLNTELISHFEVQLSILHQKLLLASRKLDVDALNNTSSKIARIKYVLWAKDPLQRSIEDLERWNNSFQPSWYSIALSLKTTLPRYMTDARLSSEASACSLDRLRQVLGIEGEDAQRSQQTPIFVEDPGLHILSEIHFSTSAFAYSEKALGRPLIVDTVSGAPEGSSLVLDSKDLRNLGRKLSVVDPLTFGLLQCKGIVKCEDEDGELSECRFLFDVPNGLVQPLSLRSMLLGPSVLALSERLHLAKVLARAVMFVHNLEFVHKNIRPETIVVLKDQSAPINHPFLLGFEEFRTVDRPTTSRGTLAWEKNLYRHPSRQGINLINKTHMQHDMYSLGVCMLEVGLWSSFVIPGERGLSDSVDPLTRCTPSKDLAIEEFLQWSDQRKKAWKIKDSLVAIAESRLPINMGDIYTEVVLTCLNAWQDGNNSFGDKKLFMDSDGIIVGVKYSEKIITKLEEIVM